MLTVQDVLRVCELRVIVSDIMDVFLVPELYTTARLTYVSQLTGVAG